MVFEGDTIEFTLTNQTQQWGSFYWGIEATKGFITDSDFENPPNSNFTYLSLSYDLLPGESKTFQLKTKNDKLIEGLEQFRIFSTRGNSNERIENKTIIADFSIKDTEQPLLSVTSTSLHKGISRGLDLAAPPGKTKSLISDDFQFAIQEQQTSDGDTFTTNPIKNIISLSPSSFILQYNEGYGTSESNRLVLATKNKQKNLQESISYQELPKFSTHRYSQTINAAFDSKGNLYSIHNYYPNNSTEERKRLLLKHNQKGKEVFQTELSSYNPATIAADNKGGLLISSTNYNNDRISIERRNSRTGNQIWSSEPFFCGFTYTCGSFNKSSRSIQPLDDGSFLTAASGYLDLSERQSASHIAKVSLKDGSLQALLEVDNDPTYTDHEFFINEGQIIFRTSIRAYEVSVDAKPIHPFEFPTIQADEDSNRKSLIHQLTKPKRFRRQFVDKITNFKPNEDTLSVLRSDFDVGKRIKFATGKNKRAARALSNQELDFIYDQKKGGLYYNENGADRGFGNGGLIAILKGAPDISTEHIQSI